MPLSYKYGRRNALLPYIYMDAEDRRSHIIMNKFHFGHRKSPLSFGRGKAPLPYKFDKNDILEGESLYDLLYF